MSVTLEVGVPVVSKPRRHPLRFLSCLLNWITFGNPRQTFSARAGEAVVAHKKKHWKPIYNFINWAIRFPRHCANAFYRDLPMCTYRSTLLEEV